MNDPKKAATFHGMFTPFPDGDRTRAMEEIIADTRIEIGDQARINGRAVIIAPDVQVDRAGDVGVAVTLTIYAPDVHITPSKMPANLTITFERNYP